MNTDYDGCYPSAGTIGCNAETTVQQELLPQLKRETGGLTPELEQPIHVLEWVRIEEFVAASWCGNGRPPHGRSWFADAFVAKAVLGLTTTAGWIERLQVDRALRRICGFSLFRKLPSESTFSRAFQAFSQGQLAERVHEALIQAHLGKELIGHLCRDGTAIEARERPALRKDHAAQPAASASPIAGQRTCRTGQ